MAQGAIKWFSNESGYGFIHPDNGGPNLLVRRGYMVGGEFESPKKGDRVTYDVTQGAKGLWTMNVSKAQKIDTGASSAIARSRGAL